MTGMKHLAQKIRAADHLLLSTHKDPDGDGIGSMLALARALRASGKRVDLILPDPCPERFRFLDPDRLLEWLPYDAAGFGGTRPDLAVIVDTHQWALLGHIGELLKLERIPTLFFDHHPLRDGRRSDVISDPNASSNGELVYRLLTNYLDLPIDQRIGECLYASIAFDTHSFRYIRNSPTPHLVAADLLSRGVDANEIYRHLFASNPVGKLRLMGRLMGAVKIDDGGRLAWVGLPLAWIREHGVCEDDMRDAVNCLLEIEGIEVAALLKEVGDREVKVSLRSKGRFEIHEVAQQFGGGGHPYAAGATICETLADSCGRVLERLESIMREDRPA
ncbi:MAG: hypothetical protein GF346_04465 [Candidatus Eisenbacteria bacterium]|nr:hypothetical protein [Candidatus Latescibacterota bacterium]MBD3301681.1 hypothetical protein [Candidatus Eisenbacteria bacterium]